MVGESIEYYGKIRSNEIVVYIGIQIYRNKVMITNKCK